MTREELQRLYSECVSRAFRAAAGDILRALAGGEQHG